MNANDGSGGNWIAGRHHTFCAVVSAGLQSALAATHRVTRFDGFCVAFHEVNIDLRLLDMCRMGT